ncbi:hypothetical protein [Euzebya pacifica]|uniref:hypothetical protein n=1 Tax=Euzebya pacifica TaxID=1608957 RepID=UPI000DF85CC9|nr:hypothetical protein [Euzebya pacifica]
MPQPVVLVDDPAIADDMLLLRQVNPAHGLDWTTTDADGCPRITGRVFDLAGAKKSELHGYPQKTLSLYLAEVVYADHRSLEAWMTSRPAWGVVSIAAGLLRREANVGIMRDDMAQLSDEELRDVARAPGRSAVNGHTVAWALGSNKAVERASELFAENAKWAKAPQSAS